LVLDHYSVQLDSINKDSLNFESKERYDRVHKLLGYLKTIKVVDAPVLLKIYNMYRSQI
jgi:hypothetical protein